MAQAIQSTQRLKAEISSELDLLSLDNLETLSKFVAFLRSNSEQTKQEKSNGIIALNEPKRMLRIASPRLAIRQQITDFKKEIVE